MISTEEIERKVAVIFATDVVSYSKHIEIDESNTLKNLRSCEKILMELFAKYKGRLFELYKPRREVFFDYKVNIKPGSGEWFDDRNRVRREF